MSAAPTLDAARDALATAQGVIDQAIATAKGLGPAAHDDQTFLYALSHAAAAVSMGTTALD